MLETVPLTCSDQFCIIEPQMVDDNTTDTLTNILSNCSQYLTVKKYISLEIQIRSLICMFSSL